MIMSLVLSVVSVEGCSLSWFVGADARKGVVLFCF